MIGHKLNPRFTFEQFACGSCNQFACSSAYATATNAGAVFNPLIIYGTHGLGKSHLLHAIGHQAIAYNSTTRVICCSADVFMHEMIEHIRTNQMHSFRENFCSVDLLLIDDIQRLAQKERTQQELLSLYDKLTAHQVQIVLAIDRHPLKLTGFDDTLHSRFSGGLMVELTEPDYETKRAILEKLAVRHQIKLPEDVANYLANLQVRSIRELEGGLIRLGTYSSLKNVEISLPLAMKHLQDMTGNASNLNEKMEASMLWNNSTMDTFYYDGEADTDSACEVRIDGKEIVISYDGDEGPVVYKGEAKGVGHYELRSAGVEGRATLHMFEGGKFLEGFWIEDGTEGMWRITLK